MTITSTEQVAGTGLDVVAASVKAYSDYAVAYADLNAEAMAEQVDRFMGLLPEGGSVLDAGCGPGRDMARFAAAGFRPVGLDLTPEFVAMAGSFGPVVHGDLREMPFWDALFDGVWACTSLVHLPLADAERALREIRRVVRPGGPVCVSVKDSGATGWRETRMGNRWFQVWTPGQFAAAVERAGLIVESVEPGPVFVDVWATAPR